MSSRGNEGKADEQEADRLQAKGVKVREVILRSLRRLKEDLETANLQATTFKETRGKTFNDICDALKKVGGVYPTLDQDVQDLWSRLNFFIEMVDRQPNPIEPGSGGL